VTTRNLMKHLHMGCGEPLKTSMKDKQETKKIISNNRVKPADKQAKKH